MNIDSIRHNTAPNDANETQNACFALLDDLNIAYEWVGHEPAATIALCHLVEERLEAAICKNLFLCNRQKTQFYLLLMQGDKVFKTKFLSKQLNTARLSFADSEDLQAYLHLKPGSASVLGLMHDKENRVQLVIDRPVLQTQWFACHPCDNTATLRFKTAELQKLLNAMKHEAIVVDLPEEDE